MSIWEQNDWRVPDSFSTGCRYKRDAIFEIQWQEMRYGSPLTWSQGLFGFRLTRNYQSVSKGQLQVKSPCWSFSEEFTGSHTIAGSQKIAHSIHHSFVKKFLIHLLRKCSQIPQKLANLWLWLIWTMQEFTRQWQPKRSWMFPDSSARRSQRIARILHHPTFSLRLAENQA
jgi:hypothetical protein